MNYSVTDYSMDSNIATDMSVTNATNGSITIITTDGVRCAYPASQVRSCSYFAVTREGSEVTVPCSKEQFALMHHYLNGENPSSFIDNNDIATVKVALDFVTKHASHEFIDKIREHMATRLYNIMRKEITADSRSKFPETCEHIRTLME